MLAPLAGEFDIEAALEDWRWLVPQTVRPLIATAMGDLFMIASDGAVLFLDTIEGTCEQAATSVEDWERKLGDPELVDRWFMPALVMELRESTPLCQGECYSPKHAPVVGGTFSGCMHEAIKDLPDGTQITKWNYTKL